MSRCIAIFVALVLLFAGWSNPPSNTRESSPKSEETTFDCILEFNAAHKSISRVDTIMSLAEVYAQAGKRDRAFQLMQDAQKVAAAEAEQGHPSSLLPRASKPDTLSDQLARGYLKIGALDYAIAFSRQIVDPHFRARNLAGVAAEIAATGDKKKAISLLVEARRITQDPEAESWVLADISSAYAKLGNCDEARRIALAMSDSWPHIKAPELARIASHCAKNGSRKSAAQLVSESVRVVGLMNDETLVEGKYEVLAHAASAQIDLGEKESALRMLAQALAGARKTEFNMIAMEAIADAYANARLYEKATEVAKSIDYRPSQADALLSIARRCVSAGDKAVAIGLLDQSLQIALEDKHGTPTLRFGRLAGIAVEYVKAERANRARDVLVESLRQLRREDYEQTELMLAVFSGYARSKLTPDEKAKQLIADLCSGKAFKLTPEEEAKQRRVEEAADRFIDRWHQTLDMNVLFDELYISNSKQRQLNAQMFYGVYKFLSGSIGPSVDKDVDEALMRDGFFTFWNLFYLIGEYQLAYSKPEDHTLTEPPELKNQSFESRRTELDEKRMTRRQVEAYINKTRASLPLYRKYLTPEVFKTERYLDNLRREKESSGETEKRFKIMPGFPEFGVPNDVEVYYLRKGVFEFYFVEENGKLKVLTLGFEL